MNNPIINKNNHLKKELAMLSIIVLIGWFLTFITPNVEFSIFGVAFHTVYIKFLILLSLTIFLYFTFSKACRNETIILAGFSFVLHFINLAAIVGLIVFTKDLPFLFARLDIYKLVEDVNNVAYIPSYQMYYIGNDIFVAEIYMLVGDKYMVLPQGNILYFPYVYEDGTHVLKIMDTSNFFQIARILEDQNGIKYVELKVFDSLQSFIKYLDNWIIK